MDVYYHKTSGGAEYLSTTYVECPNGEREGTFEGVFARIDGGDFELFPEKLEKLGFDSIVIGNIVVKCE